MTLTDVIVAATLTHDYDAVDEGGWVEPVTSKGLLIVDWSADEKRVPFGIRTRIVRGTRRERQLADVRRARKATAIGRTQTGLTGPRACAVTLPVIVRVSKPRCLGLPEWSHTTDYGFKHDERTSTSGWTRYAYDAWRMQRKC